MSTIRKERGIWTYYSYVGKRQVHRSLQTADRKIALDRKKILDLEFGSKRWIDRRIRFEDFQTQYVEWTKARKPHGTSRNETMALKRLNEALRPGLLMDVDAAAADSFITGLAGEMTPAGVNFYIRTLRSVFQLAVEWNMIQENPFRKVRLLSVDLPAPRILTRAEIAAVFGKLQELAPQFVPLIAFYLMTGMRRNEALRLEWGDVNFESGVITVKKAKGRRPRLIPMAPAARRILLSRRSLVRPFDWYPDTVSKTFRKAAKAAEVTDVTLHDLRRTFGTLLAQAGVNAMFIQRWLGHADIEVTREHYIGLPEETRQQLASLRKVLPKGIGR